MCSSLFLCPSPHGPTWQVVAEVYHKLHASCFMYQYAVDPHYNQNDNDNDDDDDDNEKTLPSPCTILYPCTITPRNQHDSTVPTTGQLFSPLDMTCLCKPCTCSLPPYSQLQNEVKHILITFFFISTWIIKLHFQCLFFYLLILHLLIIAHLTQE